MGINIWLPIVVNLLILGIMVAGVLVGRKYGFKVEAIKTIILCGLGVGIYFLSPIIVGALLHIEFLAQAVISGVISIASIKLLVIYLLFMIVYGIVSLIIRLIVNKKLNKGLKVNRAKEVKARGINRAETAKLRKEQRRFRKIAKKNNKKLLKENRKHSISKRSKVFGAIVGFICAVIVGFVVTLPLKSIFIDIAHSDSAISDITYGYEYTPYGQLDKVTDIVERIVK